MRTPQRALIAIVVALSALVVASMASAETSPIISPDTPTSSPGHGGSGVGTTCTIDHPDCNDSGLGGSLGGEPQIVEPTPGMINVRQTTFDTATIRDDDTTMAITFWSGVEPCSVLDHVDVAYGADAVTITLFQGSDPDAGDVACIDIAVQKQVTITLDEPLAGRAIADGAA